MNDEVEQTYSLIKERVINHEIYQNIKDYSKEKEKVITYLEIGRLLDNIGTKYGTGVIKEYSKRLTNEFGKKYTTSLLYKIKQFYSISKKVPTMSGKLSWSHWYEMLSIKDTNKIIYYINQCEINNLDVRSLRLKIKSNEYERLDESTKLKFIKNEDFNVVDFVKSPIVIKNFNNIEIVKEKALKKLILEDIEHFMKELGNSFCFIGSEYKIKIGNRYNYIDLLLYNIKYKCYVVIGASG